MYEFYVTPPIEFIAIMGGIIAILIILDILVLKGRQIMKKTQFLPKEIKVIALIAITSILIILSLLTTMHFLVKIVIVRSKVIVEIPYVLTCREFNKNDIIKVYIANIYEEKGLRPVIRLAGTSLGTYHVGWFKLANGKIALIVTHSAENLIIETRSGLIVILRPDNFDKFIKVFNREVMKLEG